MIASFFSNPHRQKEIVAPSPIGRVVSLTPLQEIEVTEQFFPNRIERTVMEIIKQNDEENSYEQPEKQVVFQEGGKGEDSNKIEKKQRKSLKQGLAVFEQYCQVELNAGKWSLVVRNFTRELKKRNQIKIISEALQSADQSKIIVEIIVANCDRDVIEIINEVAEKKKSTKMEVKRLIITKSEIVLKQLRTLFYTNCYFLTHIDINSSRITSHNSKISTNRFWRFFQGTSLLRREEVIRSLFIQDLFKPPVLHQIQSIKISLVNPLEGFLNAQDQVWEEERYYQAAEELQGELEAHVLMRNNIVYTLGAAKGYKIEESTFGSEKGLQYTLDILEASCEQIQEITFMNLYLPNLSIFKLVIARVRQLPLKSIAFVNVPLYIDHLNVVKNLLWWKQKELRRVVFGQNKMTQDDFEYLFSSNNLKIKDFSQLQEMEFFDNQEVLKSIEYQKAQMYLQNKRLKKAQKSQNQSDKSRIYSAPVRNPQLKQHQNSQTQQTLPSISPISTQLPKMTSTLPAPTLNEQSKIKSNPPLNQQMNNNNLQIDQIKIKETKVLKTQNSQKFLNVSKIVMEFQKMNVNTATLQLPQNQKNSNQSRQTKYYQFQNGDEMKDQIQVFCQVGCRQMFRAEKEDSMATILKSHFFYKDCNTLLDLTKVNMAKCSPQTLKCLVDYISQSKRLEKLYLPSSCSSEFAFNLSVKINSFHQQFEAVEISFPESQIYSISNDHLILLLDSFLNSSKMLVLKDLRILSQDLVEKLDKIFSKNSKCSVVLDNFFVDESSTPQNKIAALLSCWWKPNILKTIRWKKVVKTKWMAHVIELALKLQKEEMYATEIELDENKITARTVFELMRRNKDTLQTLRILNCFDDSFDVIGFSEENKNNDKEYEQFYYNVQCQTCDLLLEDNSVYMKELTTVDLSGCCQIAGMLLLYGILVRSPSVKQLYLAGNEKQALLSRNCCEQLSGHLLEGDLIKKDQLEVLDISLNMENQDEKKSQLVGLIDSVLKSQSKSIQKLIIKGSQTNSNVNTINEFNIKQLISAFSSSGKLEKLTFIDLSFNVIKLEVHAYLVGQLFQKIGESCPNLKVLKFTGKQSESTVRDTIAEQISSILSTGLFKNIQDLDFSQNLAMKPEGFSQFLTALFTYCPKIEVLNLSGSESHVMLTNEKARMVTELIEEKIQSFQFLKEINLSRNVALSAEILGKLLEAVIQNCRNLEVIKLVGYNMFSMIENEKAKSISQALMCAAKKKIKLIDISCNQIDAGPLNQLFSNIYQGQNFYESHEINKLTTMKTRKLHNNDQRVEEKKNEDLLDIYMIQNGGQIFNNLIEAVFQEIALMNSTLLENSLKTLFGASSKTLKRLRLLGSEKMESIGDERVERLSAIFKEYSKYLVELTSVDLSMNSINSMPLKELLDSIALCKNLNSISLCGTGNYSMINNQKASALIEFFENMNRLEYLDLSSNYIDELEILDQLLFSVVHNSSNTLKSINLYYNHPIQANLNAKALSSAFQQSFTLYQQMEESEKKDGQEQPLQNTQIDEFGNISLISPLKNKLYSEENQFSALIEQNQFDFKQVEPQPIPPSPSPLAKEPSKISSFFINILGKSSVQNMKSLEEVIISLDDCTTASKEYLQKTLKKVCQKKVKIVTTYAFTLPPSKSSNTDLILDSSFVHSLDLQTAISKFSFFASKAENMIFLRSIQEEIPLLSFCFSFNQPLKSLQINKFIQNDFSHLHIGDLFFKVCRSLLPITPACQYLHSIILNKSFFESMKQSLEQKKVPNFSIKIIFPSSTQNPGFECIKDDSFIREIFDQSQPIAGLHSIQLEYEFDQQDQNYKNLSQLKIIQRLLLMPPSILKTKPKSNLEFLKVIYSIFYDSVHFQGCQIDLNQASSVNSGIAVSLLEKLYLLDNSSRTSCFSFFLKKFFFRFLSSISEREKIFKFDDQVVKLNLDLEKEKLRELLLIFLNFMQIFAQATPIIFYLLFPNESQVDLRAYYIFGVFGIFSLIVEISLYFRLMKYISHLVSEVKFSQSTKTISQVMTKIKKFLFSVRIIDFQFINYIIKLLLSLLSRYDTFSDFAFIVICFQSEQIRLAYISLSVLLTNLFFRYVGFLRYLFRRRKIKRKLNTDNIQQYCKIASLAECSALTEVLDQICPYNVRQLPNCFIFGQLRGQAVNSLVLAYILKFLFKNSPQIVLQILYLLYSNNKSGLTLTVILSMATSVLSFFVSFLKFMSIRPSTITQIHFNELAMKKKNRLTRNFAEIEQISKPQIIKAFLNYFRNTTQINSPVKKSKFYKKDLQIQIPLSPELRIKITQNNNKMALINLNQINNTNQNNNDSYFNQDNTLTELKNIGQ